MAAASSSQFHARIQVEPSDVDIGHGTPRRPLRCCRSVDEYVGSAPRDANCWCCKARRQTRAMLIVRCSCSLPSTCSTSTTGKNTRCSHRVHLARVVAERLRAVVPFRRIVAARRDTAGARGDFRDNAGLAPRDPIPCPPSAPSAAGDAICFPRQFHSAEIGHDASLRRPCTARNRSDHPGPKPFINLDRVNRDSRDRPMGLPALAIRQISSPRLSGDQL